MLDKQILFEHLETLRRRVSILAFVRDDPPSPAGVVNNGTVSFVRLPGGSFVITNWHVWQHYQEETAIDPSYKLVLTGHGCSKPIDFSSVGLVSEDRDLDLCVLKYPADRIESLGKEFYSLLDEPPTRACANDEVIVTGFPGMRRSVENMIHPESNQTVPFLRHEAFSLLLRVEATSQRAIRFGSTTPNPHLVEFSEQPTTDFRWGGMSGSLVYRLDSVERRLSACGILHSASEGVNATFLATHLDFIQSDGQIIPP